MKEPLVLLVEAEQAQQRIDKFLALSLPNMTRSGLQKLLADGAVLLDGKEAQKNDKVKPGDRVEVYIPEPKPMEAEAQDIPLDIVYEDEDLLVVDKPRGMVVHPAAGHQDGTLVNALLAHCGDSLSGINGVLRPGIVHRIDKDTSGLLIVAKNDAAHQHLAEQIKVHSFTRQYQAVVHGTVKQDSGVVRLPIGRHKTDRKRMAVVSQGGKEAVTHYQIVHRYVGYTHLLLTLETGRTHQIRVHMAHMGHPVAGDPVYGPKKPALAGGQCLHASKIGFVHPRRLTYLEFESPLPAYFTDFLQRLHSID